MLEISSVDPNISSIVNNLVRKNKRGLYRKGKQLKLQAEHFTPAYRDFISNIIKNGSLSIKQRWNAGSLATIRSTNTDKLSKRGVNIIKTDIDRVDTLPHELGHAVDFWFGRYHPLSGTVVLWENKTLREIFNEEFASQKEHIYKHIMEEFKQIVNSNINPQAYDLLMGHIDKYRQLNNIPLGKYNSKNHKARQKILKELYLSGFVEVYYQLATTKCYSILNTKYSPILDALSSSFDIGDFFLDHHLKDYYERNPNASVEEFFANVFEAKVTSKQAQYDSLIKFLPKSFNAFERLFVIFYDHIQNNKRFTDLTIKLDDKE